MARIQHGQDWEPVVVRKKAPTAKQTQSESAVNVARRTGGQVETLKKFTAATNSAAKGGPIKNAGKLENETEELSHERVSSDLKKTIIQARSAKKLTQTQLAQLINEKPQVIQEYESGKAIPNPQVLSKLSRVLGVPLSSKPKPKK